MSLLFEKIFVVHLAINGSFNDETLFRFKNDFFISGVYSQYISTSSYLKYEALPDLILIPSACTLENKRKKSIIHKENFFN